MQVGGTQGYHKRAPPAATLFDDPFPSTSPSGTLTSQPNRGPFNDLLFGGWWGGVVFLRRARVLFNSLDDPGIATSLRSPPSIHALRARQPHLPPPILRSLLLFSPTDIHTARKCMHAHAYTQHTCVSIAIVPPTHPWLYIYRPIDRRQRRPTQYKKLASQPWRAPRLTSPPASSAADGHALRARPGVPAAHPPAGGGARPRLRLPLRLGCTPACCFPAHSSGGFVFLADCHQVPV